MRATVTMLLLAGVCALAACGGSGSSGFDVSPLTESEAITQAIDTGECVTFESQRLCASGAPATSGDFEGASVIIEDPDEPLVCHDANGNAQECTASVEFTTEGFTQPSTLHGAVAASEEGPWHLARLTVSGEPGEPRTVTIEVPVDPTATTPTPVIAAVLVYPSPPDIVPVEGPRLNFFGTDLVYVSSRLEIVVPR